MPSCKCPEMSMSKESLMHAIDKNISEKQDLTRNFPDSNKQSTALRIDDDFAANNGTNVISSEEIVSPSSGDKEWEIIYNFQRDYRLKNEISMRNFMELLGTLPFKFPDSFLWNCSKKIPSSTAGTAGRVLREKLKEFMEKEQMSCEYTVYT